MRYSNIVPPQERSAGAPATRVIGRPSAYQCDSGTSPLTIAK